MYTTIHTKIIPTDGYNMDKGYTEQEHGQEVENKAWVAGNGASVVDWKVVVATSVAEPRIAAVLVRKTEGIDVDKQQIGEATVGLREEGEICERERERERLEE